MIGTKRFRLSLTSQRALAGIIFVLPFVIGFMLFFAYPFVQAIQFSLSDLKVTTTGYTLTYIGLENYRKALFVNPNYVRNLVGVFGKMLAEVPVIIGFSFFAAVLLSQEFKGRLLARLIFFLPVILGSGIVLRIEQWDLMHALLETGGTEGGGVFGGEVANFLMQFKLPESAVTYIVSTVEQIPRIIRSSGIQIVIFLAGLESIPSSFYEASEIEGASGWESFWMITFPMLTPLILTNVVYTIIDSFTAPDNTLVTMIQDGAFSNLGFGQSMAMTIMYFAVIAAVLAVVMRVLSKGVFYHD